MFRNLIPRPATSFHVVAPGYPGFGQSSMPSHKDFAYTFENLTTRAHDKPNYFRVLYNIRLRAWDQRDFDCSVFNSRTNGRH